MLVSFRQLELEKSCSAWVEERLTGGCIATNEATALRRAAPRERKDTQARARQLEREEERDREEREKLL